MKCKVGLSMSSDYYEHVAECPECDGSAAVERRQIRHAAEARMFAAMTYDPQTRTWTGSGVSFTAVDIIPPREPK